MSDQDVPHTESQRSTLARALLRSEKQGGPSRRALMGSLILHGLLGATILLGAQIQPQEQPPEPFKTYRVEIYSPPPQVEGPPSPPKELPKPPIVKQVKPP